MKLFRFVFVLAILGSLMALFTISCSSDSETPMEMEEDPPPPVNVEGFVDVTFLGNQGVLLDDGEHRVIIDGMHQGGGAGGFWTSLSQAQDALMQGAQPPFNSINVSLVTHNHTDHYSVSVIGHHLFNSPSTQFLAISGVRNALQGFGDFQSISSQVITNINPSSNNRQSATINGVEIEALNMHHFTEVCGECGRNYAYIVTLGNLKMLHLGDVDMLDNNNVNSFNLAAEDIDILFLATPFPQFVSAAQRTILNSWISPKKIVALHINSNQRAAIVANINSTYPDATILTQVMTTVRFEKKDFVD